MAAAAGDVSATGCLLPPPARSATRPADPDDDGGRGGAEPHGALAAQPAAQLRGLFRGRLAGACEAPPDSRAAWTSGRRERASRRRGLRRHDGRGGRRCGRRRGWHGRRNGSRRGRPARPASRRSAASTASGAWQTVRRGQTVRPVRRQGEPQACRRRCAFRSLRSLRIHHFRASLPRLDARRKDPFPGVHYGTLSKMPGGAACRRGAVRGCGARNTVHSGRPGEQLQQKACNLGVRQIDQTFRGLTDRQW